MQENNLAILSYKILARFFLSCKKNFIFSARLARYVRDFAQDLGSLARKILARFAYFLQGGFYWVVRKTGPLCLVLVGFTAGRQADWQTK